MGTCLAVAFRSDRIKNNKKLSKPVQLLQVANNVAHKVNTAVELGLASRPDFSNAKIKNLKLKTTEIFFKIT